MENSRCSIKVGNNLTESFDVKKGFRQGDALSCDFFNIVIERIVQSSHVNTRGTIFQKAVQLLHMLMTLTLSKELSVISIVSMEAEAAKMDLTVNEGKAKYMLSSRKDIQHRRLGHRQT